MNSLENNLNNTDSLKTPVFIDFFAEWCSPCQMFEPIFEELKGKLGEKVDFIKIDVDQFPEIALKYHVKSVPTLVIIKNGEEKWRMSGFLFAKELEKILEPHL